MNAAVDISPPVQYDIAWVLIVGGLTLIALVFYIVLFQMTKKMKPEENILMMPRIANGAERLSLIKNNYAGKVYDIQKAYHNGDISDRKAFQALSVNLRNFTHEYSGSGAHAMTLTDLNKTQAPELLKEKIQNYYPLAFEEAERTSNVDLAVEDALKVIAIWA